METALPEGHPHYFLNFPRPLIKFHFFSYHLTLSNPLCIYLLALISLGLLDFMRQIVYEKKTSES